MRPRLGTVLVPLLAVLAACGSTQVAEPVTTTAAPATTTAPPATPAAPATTSAPATTAAPATTVAPTTTAAAPAETTTAAPPPTTAAPATTTVAPAVTTTAAPTTTTAVPYDNGPYLAAIDDYVATNSDWNAAPAIGTCMVANADRLPEPARDLVARYGLMNSLGSMGSLGASASTFFSIWNGCITEGEQATPVTSTGGSSPSNSCAGSLTTLPVDRSKIMGVVPLGHLAPPSHTQSTDHVYFLLPGYETQNVASVDVVAPADGNVVTLASYTSDYTGSTFTDWQVTISTCADGTIRFGHVSTISDDLLALTTGPAESCNTYGYTGYMHTSCVWMGQSVDLAVSAGDFIGTAAGLNTPNTQLDFWAYDWGGELAPAIDQAAQPEGILRTVCPLDWFRDDLRSELYGMRMENNGIVADEATGCGKVFQDVPGTAKGFWYATVPVDGKWLDHLALVDTNTRSDHQAISVAALVANPGYWIFQKASSGTTNLDFAQVTSGSGIHCYDTFTADSNGPTGSQDHFLIEVVDDDILLIEHGSGNCGGGGSFSSPHTYSRYQM